MKHPGSLINRTRSKKYVLMIANEKSSKDIKPPKDTKYNMDRAYALMARKKYTQVSDDLMNEIDRAVRKLITDRVNNQIQSGKTVR